MAHLKKINTILPARGESPLLDAIRETLGKDLKSETEFVLDSDGEKVHCGENLIILIDGYEQVGRFEISESGQPILIFSNDSLILIDEHHELKRI